MDRHQQYNLSPYERMVRDIVREIVMDAVYVAERNGESLHSRLSKVMRELHATGTGLSILTKIGWPKHVSDVINELLEEVRPLLLLEGRCTERMKSELENDKARGVDLDDGTDIIKLDGRYFVRPARTEHVRTQHVRTEHAVGVDLDDE